MLNETIWHLLRLADNVSFRLPTHPLDDSVMIPWVYLIHRTPLISVSAKNPQPSNVSDIWVHDYHLGTRTIEVFIPSWDKHATMPLMRIAVCFDGRTTADDHIFTKPLPALSRFLTCPIFRLPYTYLCLLCHSYCYYPVFLFFLHLLFRLFISSPHVLVHLVSFCTHSSARFPATTTRFSLLFHSHPLRIRLTYLLLQFYSFILPITTFTTRYSPFSFTYIHIITHIPALLLLYSSCKSNIKNNTYSTGS